MSHRPARYGVSNEHVDLLPIMVSSNRWHNKHDAAFTGRIREACILILQCLHLSTAFCRVACAFSMR